MKKAFVFRGSPSSGKGTITQQFIKLIPNKVALLELDTFRWGFHFINREVSDVSDEEHWFAYKNFLLLLESYLKNGNYDLVIVGLFAWNNETPHGNMQDIISLLKKYDFEYKLFLLSAEKEILWQRNSQREYVVPREEFELLFHNVMDEKGEQEISVDVGSMSIEETITFIGLESGFKNDN